MVNPEKAVRHDPGTVARFVADGFWNDDTSTTYLRRWAETRPDSPAILGEDCRVSYGEVFAAARRLANGLLDLGLRKGDVIAIQLANRPEYVIAYFAVTMMGGVLSPLHTPYRAGEMAPLLNHGGARAVICAQASEAYDAPAAMRALKAEVPTLEYVILANGPAVPGTAAVDDLIARSPDRDVAAPPVAADFAVLGFTSGTSAAPKAVLRSYENLISNARVFAPEVALGPNDVIMSGPPFTHLFGICCINLALVVGGANLLMSHFTPDAFAAAIERGRATVVFGAPAHLAATLKAGCFDRFDMTSVRDIIVGGSVCPPEVAASVEAKLPGGRIGQLFGMSESILITQTPLGAGPEVRHYTSGPATPGIEIRVTAPDGRVLPPGEEGEMEIRGYSVIAGYYGNDEANRASFREDGWFRSGDLAVLDENGNLAITGRVKDIINRGSIKINPSDIESLIDAHADVVQSAIVPMPDDVLGEKACLFVTLVPGASLTLEAVTAYLADHEVAKMRWPERLEVIEEMPMTPTRKIVKSALAGRLGEVRFQGAEKS